MPAFASNEPLALNSELLSKPSQHAKHSFWDGDMPTETLAEQEYGYNPVRSFWRAWVQYEVERKSLAKRLSGRLKIFSRCETDLTTKRTE